MVSGSCWIKRLVVDQKPHKEIKVEELVVAGFNTSLAITGIALMIGAFFPSLLVRITNIEYYIAVSGFISLFIGISGVITSFGSKA